MNVGYQVAFFGKVQPIPSENILAQTSHALFECWFAQNYTDKTQKHTYILDTKNCLLDVAFLSSHPQIRFDEALTHAEDIDFGKSIIDAGKKIVVIDATVKHNERTTMLAFLKHRLRLSRSYAQVNTKNNLFLKSASGISKFLYVWKNLKHNILFKTYAILLLAIVGVITQIESMLATSFHRDDF